ncbi:hypothetical protein Q8G47_28505, partial [Klebsiella pneumoniae]|uniref:hypothetical protein n=1 Tax=Klebsiella pneumoniae TaxID=573 RepID=UPI00301388EE
VGGQSGNVRADKLNTGEINVYGKNCEFLWATGPASAADANSVNTFGIDRAYFQKCIAAHSLKDGFNYASVNSAGVQKTATKFIEIDCHSY